MILLDKAEVRKSNKLIYDILQASLYKITNYMLAISFSINKENDIELVINVLAGVDPQELRVPEFQAAIRNKLPEYNIQFKAKTITKNQFISYEFETLNHAIFLRNSENI